MSSRFVSGAPCCWAMWPPFLQAPMVAAGNDLDAAVVWGGVVEGDARGQRGGARAAPWANKPSLGAGRGPSRGRRA